MSAQKAGSGSDIRVDSNLTSTGRRGSATTTNLTRTRTLGLFAAALTAVAGLIEVAVGSTSWTGDKSEPTSLGIFTIVLAAIMAAAAVMSTRSSTSGSSLAVGAGITVPALITFTTAGLVAIPGAVVGLAAGAFAIADATQRAALRRTISTAWPTALIAVLASIYLAFGAIAGPIGILGIAGAAAAIAALAVKSRSRRLAAILLVGGIIPFALATWWSVVIPFTAILILAIELPQLLSSQPSAPAPHG